jgi:hypothetical protein
MTQVALATEDELSEAVGLRLLDEYGMHKDSPLLLRKNGNGYLRSKMANWRQLAEHQIVFILTDLDRVACPVALLKDWLGDRACPSNLLLRVAVREIESWILADHQGVRELVGNNCNLPDNPDELRDPKQELLALAQRAPRSVKEDLVAKDGAIARQGIAYNNRLVSWVKNVWSPVRAAEKSQSLHRTRLALAEMSQSLDR